MKTRMEDLGAGEVTPRSRAHTTLLEDPSSVPSSRTEQLVRVLMPQASAGTAFTVPMHRHII